MKPIFNKYGVGIPLSDEYELNTNKVKEEANSWLVENFNESFSVVTTSELPDDYINYYWIKWVNLESGIQLASFRKEMHTPMDCTIKDVLEYDGYEELLPYKYSYFISFPIMYIRKMCKKHLGGFTGKKVLVLGCGTGECLLLLSAYGMQAEGIELNKYAFDYAHPSAKPLMTFGDFLVDLNSIPNNSYDLVFTNMFSWVNKVDVLPVLIEISRISKLFIQQHLSDGNSYKSRSMNWWRKQFNKAGMGYFPSSSRIALCKGGQK